MELGYRQNIESKWCSRPKQTAYRCELKTSPVFTIPKSLRKWIASGENYMKFIFWWAIFNFSTYVQLRNVEKPVEPTQPIIYMFDMQSKLTLGSRLIINNVAITNSTKPICVICERNSAPRSRAPWISNAENCSDAIAVKEKVEAQKFQLPTWHGMERKLNSNWRRRQWCCFAFFFFRESHSFRRAYQLRIIRGTFSCYFHIQQFKTFTSIA